MAEENRERFPAKMTIPLLAIALVASLAWGFSQFQARRNWEIRAENQYNRSFSELSTHVGEIETKLAEIMVCNSRPNLVKGFSDLWRQTYLSQEDLGQLPLPSVELGRTKEFLAKVGAFSFDAVSRLNQDTTAVTASTGKSVQYLSEEEWTTVNTLHRQARYLADQLVDLQESMLESGERWIGVDRLSRAALSADVSDRLDTNKITKSFMMMEDGFKRLPEPEMDSNLLNFQPVPKGITGQDISQEQGRELASSFINKEEPGYEVTYNEKINGDYPLYLYNLKKKKENGKAADSGRIALTIKGGHPAWLLKERPAAEQKLSLAAAKEAARKYLERRNYTGMKPVGAEEYRNVAVVALCSTNQETIIYPEMIKVQVALDDGEVMGVETMSYLTFHNPERKIARPSLSEAEAKKRLNQHFKVEEINQAVILNDKHEEVLTYECVGRIAQDRYRVYLNAETGEEERIQRVNEEGFEDK
ncbi:MAG TPA: germination protein YpeB [Firmicutes bacterium]|nr:germination protein YpeB [Bacillota bacterium]HBR33932.1 germination protein YpeB [Bacillota bacterium]